ncbi:MAG TPA: oligosaccharide flippase family protein, partial [Phototrophicaceae bacterium]|nr:oligosaccharide flippase family protein [Phototrophicaceae bacterium]
TVQIGFTNALGEFRTQTEWGIKNYVEGALYVGILPLALAAFAVVTSIIRRIKPINQSAPEIESTSSPSTPPYILIFALLTLISLTFMFGLKTYAVIYVLPGINQLNTAFRWVYGVTIGITILAGFGADALLNHRTAAKRFGIGLTGIGIMMLAGLLLSRIFYLQIEPLISNILNSMARANEAFDSPAMFYSYQFVNVLIFALMMLGSGIVFLWVRDDSAKITPARVFAVALVGIDLLIASGGFNPASDPLLLDFTPPAIQWLREQPGEWRYMVINNGKDRDILPANMTLSYGLDDVTGYDSIISAQYVDYMRSLAPQRILDQNRISPLYTIEDYDFNRLVTSPRFQRLNVKYIITHKSTTFADNLTTSQTRFPAQVKLAYEDEEVKIWDVGGVPRAYILSPGGPDGLDADAPLNIYSSGFVQITSDTGRELSIDVNNFSETWLVVSQSYAPGWKAFIRPQGSDEETEVKVEQVQDNFQGVYLPDVGKWTVRLIYSPPTFQIGVFVTIISAAILLLTLGIWIWQRFIAPQSAEDSSAASRLARNSIAPILLNLFNRGIDLVFASIMFRILGPVNAGYYYYAIAIFGWFDIISNFGLDVYLMREAGRHRDRAGTLFYNTSIFRFSLVLICIPLMLAFVALRESAGDPLNVNVLPTIALFYVGLIPGTLSKGLTSLFYAFEQAEYPAAIATITTICRVTFGLMMLILGYGAIGLAAVSIVTNLITLVALLFAARKMIGSIRQFRRQQTQTDTPDRLDTSLMRTMAGQSFPLMLNHLLATIFFQIDVIIMEYFRGGEIIGTYRTAYSWLLAINVIPAFFTQALMPIMSRQWHNDPATFKRTYILSIKLLVSIAFPMAVIFTVLATPLTYILGGSAYLPDGAIALQIMIWSIP